MTTTSSGGKSEGKEYLTNAIMGLIFLIGGYLIFTLINPNVLNINFDDAAARVSVKVKEINVSIDGFGGASGVNESNNCEEYNNAYKQQGLDAQRCSNGEELDGVFSWLESVGASIPNDTLQEFRKEWFDGKITPKDECEMVRDSMVDYANTRVSGSCYACNKGIGITQKYCFNYNAAEVREADIKRWKESMERQGYFAGCLRQNAAQSEDQIVHDILGGKNIPYNHGNGVVVKKFDENGGETSLLRYAQICAAGKSLGDEWEVVGEMCDFGLNPLTKTCDKVFEKLKGGKKPVISSSCGDSDWEAVYDRNIDKFRVSVKKVCKN